MKLKDLIKKLKHLPLKDKVILTAILIPLGLIYLYNFSNPIINFISNALNPLCKEAMKYFDSLLGSTFFPTVLISFPLILIIFIISLVPFIIIRGIIISGIITNFYLRRRHKLQHTIKLKQRSEL